MVLIFVLFLIRIMGKILLSAKLLKNDVNFTSNMMALNPFEESTAPDLVKADLYLYKYSQSGSQWWARKFSCSFLSQVICEKKEFYFIFRLFYKLFL